MKKYLFILSLLFLFVVGCSTGASQEKMKEVRNDAVSKINDNIDYIFATESLTDVWHIEDYVVNGEEIDEDRLFRFTDTYIMDEEEFESLNDYEKGLAMKTSSMITKCLKGEYEDKELFKEDIEEYYDVLEYGDTLFTD